MKITFNRMNNFHDFNQISCALHKILELISRRRHLACEFGKKNISRSFLMVFGAFFLYNK